MRAGNDPRQMSVEGHDDHAYGRLINAHNVISHRITSLS
jgi:hypothetical protein